MPGAKDADQDTVSTVRAQSPRDKGVEVFRTHSRRTGIWVSLGILALGAAQVMGAPSDLRLEILALCLGMFVPLSVLTYRYFAATVTAAPEGVVVRNTLRTVRVSWTEIREFEPRSYGPSRIRLMSGASIGMSALQQANWRNLTNQPLPTLVHAIDELNADLADYKAQNRVATSPPLQRARQPL